MNQRNISKIKEKINVIQSNKFNIDDVEILLINIRDFARDKKFSLLLEFCDFIAHPDRNKGIIHDEIDIFYSKFKYAPTQLGDQLDYNNIDNIVFKTLFDKAIDQLTDVFLMQNLNKNSVELKTHILKKLVKKQAGSYKAVDIKAIEELRNIQKVCNQIPPQIHVLTEGSLFDEIKVCVKDLSNDIGFLFEEHEFDKIKNNLILCFLEIIQNCKILLHDGKFANGFISVSSNNTLYNADPKIENLNLCFTVKVPIQKSFAVFDLLQTSLLVSQHIPNYSSVIEWLGNEQKRGKLMSFNISKSR